MNAERLHAIAIALRDELAETEQVGLVRRLAEALQQQASDPATPEHQQQVSTLRQQLGESLTAAPSNKFSDAWRLTLQELKVAYYLGEDLRAWLEEIFQRNTITPTVAAQEIAPNR